jgi:HEAT repeat protein
LTDDDFLVRRIAIQELARGWHDGPETLSILKKAMTDNDFLVRRIAIQELARGWHDDTKTLNI